MNTKDSNSISITYYNTESFVALNESKLCIRSMPFIAHPRKLKSSGNFVPTTILVTISNSSGV